MVSYSTYSSTLKMEAKCSSETSVNFRYCIPDDRTFFGIHCCRHRLKERTANSVEPGLNKWCECFRYSTPGAATFYCSSLGHISICLALLNAISESTWLSYRRESHRNNGAAVNWRGRGDCIDHICRSCSTASGAELDTMSCRCRKCIHLHRQT
jgi:hypothetical protein